MVRLGNVTYLLDFTPKNLLYHFHPFHFVLFKDKQHPTRTCTIQSVYYITEVTSNVAPAPNIHALQLVHNALQLVHNALQLVHNLYTTCTLQILHTYMTIHKLYTMTRAHKNGRLE